MKTNLYFNCRISFYTRKAISLILSLISVLAPVTIAFAETIDSESSLQSVSRAVINNNESTLSIPGYISYDKDALRPAQDPGLKTYVSSLPSLSVGNIDQSKASSISDIDNSAIKAENVSSNTATPVYKWLNSYAQNSGIPSISHVSGSFTYSIPLVTPPGRNGIEPKLELDYDSQAQSVQNWFGLGWSINIPYIERKNVSGTQDLYDYAARNFISSFDGELGTTTSTVNFTGKSDNGSFNQYLFDPSNPSTTPPWTMTAKDGTVYTFGTDASARLYDQSNTA